MQTFTSIKIKIKNIYFILNNIFLILFLKSVSLYERNLKYKMYLLFMLQKMFNNFLLFFTMIHIWLYKHWKKVKFLYLKLGGFQKHNYIKSPFWHQQQYLNFPYRRKSENAFIAFVIFAFFHSILIFEFILHYISMYYFI